MGTIWVGKITILTLSSQGLKSSTRTQSHSRGSI